MELIDIAKAVKRGVRLLDKKIPNWRTILRKHEDQFDFADGTHCVLGTLEHYSGRMRVLKAKRNVPLYEGAFKRAYLALGIESGQTKDFGFDWSANSSTSPDQQKAFFSALWRAEFQS